MKDFELEAILKEALADDSVPPPELNAKLVKRIKQKKKRPSYVFNMRYAAAAAVIIVVGGAAVFSNGGFTKTHTVGEVARTTTYNSDNNSENANKQAVNPAYADDNVKTEAVTDILAESQVTDKSEEKIQKSSTEVMSDRDNIVTGNEKNRADDIINSRPKNTVAPQKESTLTEKTHTDKMAVSEDKETGGNTLNQYIEIAAEGIGKALDSLNLSVNQYIGELYASHDVNMPAVAGMLRSGAGMPKLADYSAELEESQENTVNSGGAEETAKKVIPHSKNSYDVLCDSEKYYSVKINTEFDDEPERVYTKTYTIDKKKEAIVALDDLYSDNVNYKAELYDNICSQMKERMKENDNIQYYIDYGFSEITGNEDFYFNNAEEVVITFEAGAVAPYEQGQSSFNVGTPQ